MAAVQFRVWFTDSWPDAAVIIAIVAAVCFLVWVVRR
jgi:hypothetical protein